MMDKQKVVKNSLFLAVRMVFVMIISIFTTRYLLANLGIEDYGVYNVTIGIVSICTFLTPALANANQRFHNYELGRNNLKGANYVFNTGVLIQIMMVLVILLICETVGLWYINNKLVVPEGRDDAVFWIFQISVVAFSISMLQIPFISAVLAHEHMNFYALVNVLDAFFKLLIAIGIAYATYDRLVVYGILILLISVANLLSYYVYSHYNFSDVRLRRVFDKPLMKKMLSFSGWNLFETLARIGKDQGSNLLLNAFFGPVLNASRGVAGQVAYAFTGTVESTVMASRPQMVASYAQGNIQTAISIFMSLSKGILLLMLLLALPVYIETDYVLKLWLGSNIPDFAVEFVRFSLLISLIDKLASPVTALVHSTGKVKKYHVLSGVVNILVIPFAWLLLSLGFHPLSVYWITLVEVLIAQVLFLFVIRSLLPFSVSSYFKKVCQPFLVVLLLSFLIPSFIYYSMDEGLMRFVVVTVTSLFVVSVFGYLFAMSKGERQFIKSFINK